jgi:hypothetical protein
VLVWSAGAAESRWVNLEWLAAFHRNRFIVPCVVDLTNLPFFLQLSVYLDLGRREYADVLEELKRAVQSAPDRANELPPNVRTLGREARATCSTLAEHQGLVLKLLQQGDVNGAKARQRALDEPMADALRRWPMEAQIANLGAYHLKNHYQIRHRDAIAAGHAPDDPVLDEAERAFVSSLALDPTDLSAVNGLGNILFFRRDICASEFFHERAVLLANARGQTYHAAEHDLKMVRAHIAAAERRQGRNLCDP